jgi:hypothetical protein
MEAFSSYRLVEKENTGQYCMEDKNKISAMFKLKRVTWGLLTKYRINYKKVILTQKQFLKNLVLSDRGLD